MNIVLPNQKGFAHPYLILVLILVIVVLVIASKLHVVKIYPLKETGDVQGILIAKGGDDGNSGSSGSGSSDSGSSGSSSNSSDDNNDDDDDKPSGSSSSSGGSTPKPADSAERETKQSSPKPASSTIKPFSVSPKPSASTGVRVENKSNEDEVKTEIRFGEGEKIKTRVEDGRTRIDVYSGGVKVRYEIRDGRVIIKAETEDGEEVEGQDLFKIEDRLGRAGIKVATEGGKLVVTRNNVGALSNFPIQLDLNTNQLIASTSAGPKTLTTLPDQAVQNLLAANVISRLDSTILQEAAQTGGLTSVSGIVSLGERNGVPVYEINGLRDQRLFGFIPITTPVTVVVSAETGQTVAQEQPLLSTIVDLLSP